MFIASSIQSAIGQKITKLPIYQTLPASIFLSLYARFPFRPRSFLTGEPFARKQPAAISHSCSKVGRIKQDPRVLWLSVQSQLLGQLPNTQVLQVVGIRLCCLLVPVVGVKPFTFQCLNVNGYICKRPYAQWGIPDHDSGVVPFPWIMPLAQVKSMPHIRNALPSPSCF